jgi:hypothetical protein
MTLAGKPYSAFTLALIEALSGVGVAKEGRGISQQQTTIYGPQTNLVGDVEGAVLFDKMEQDSRPSFLRVPN